MLKATLTRMLRRAGLIDDDVVTAEGRLGVFLVGHRDFIGGMWDEIGRLQFDFLVGEGLQPSDVLLDVACGALRGGVHFIPYLDAGHYFGIDKERRLIAAGRRELGRSVLREKRPELVVSDSFEFSRFSRKATFALAQSLFSHLDETDVRRCLVRLRPQMETGGRFYATFFAGASEDNGERRSHSHRVFAYEPQRLSELGVAAGWTPQYVGEIGHPRGQVVMRFSA